MPKDSTRRLLDVVLTLSTVGEVVSLDALRQRFPEYDTADPEAGRRTFERDKDRLRELGLVLEHDDDAGGYRLDPRASFLARPVPLAAGDRTLLLALAEDALASPGFPFPEALTLALAKIGGGAEGPRRLLVHHPLRDDPEAVDGHLARLDLALARRKRLQMVYRPVGREAGKRTVEPYGLFLSGGHWYLCGRDVDQDAIRVYRLSRLEHLAGEDRAPKSPDFEVPADFQLRHYTGLDPVHFHLHEAITVTVQVDEEVTHLARRLWGPPVDGEATRFTFETTNADAVVDQVLELGRRAEILAPDAVRARMAEALTAILDAHGGER